MAVLTIKNVLTMTFVCITLAVAAMGEVDKEKLMKVCKKCMEETHATEDEMGKLINKWIPTTQPAKCMLACVFKAYGVFNAKGVLDEEANEKLAMEIYKEKPEKIEMTKALIAACKDQINKVVDDEKGCERAVTAHACGVEKSKELGFNMDY